MIRLCTTAISLTLACAMLASERNSEIETKQVSEIHLPPGFRSEQLGELCRQLYVPAFVDLGCGWGDDESDNNSQDYSKPTLPRYSFKKGTVRQVLDDYCGSRPFQWHIWEEGKAAWIEPKAEKNRSAVFYLDRPIQSFDADRLSPEYADGWQAALYHLQEPWRATRILPQEETTVFVCPGGNPRFHNLRSLRHGFLIRGRKEPTTMLDTARLWINQAPGCLAALDVHEDQQHHERRVTLALASLHEPLTALPTADVVSGLSLDSLKPPGYGWPVGRRMDCAYELYRRLMADKEGTIQAILREGTVEREMASEDPLLLWVDLVQVNEELFSYVYMEVFKHAKKQAQQKILEKDALPVRQADVKFWQELGRSDAPIFRKASADALEYIKQIKQDEEEERK